MDNIFKPHLWIYRFSMFDYLMQEENYIIPKSIYMNLSEPLKTKYSMIYEDEEANFEQYFEHMCQFILIAGYIPDELINDIQEEYQADHYNKIVRIGYKQIVFFDETFNIKIYRNFFVFIQRVIEVMISNIPDVEGDIIEFPKIKVMISLLIASLEDFERRTGRKLDLSVIGPDSNMTILIRLIQIEIDNELAELKREIGDIRLLDNNDHVEQIRKACLLFDWIFECSNYSLNRTAFKNIVRNINDFFKDFGSIVLRINNFLED